MRRSCYGRHTHRAVLLSLFLFLLLLLCEHRLGLVDSPSCQSFKRSSITAIITSTSTNKQPFPIHQISSTRRRKVTYLRSIVVPPHQSLRISEGPPEAASVSWSEEQQDKIRNGQKKKKWGVGGSRQGSSAAITPQPRAVPRVRVATTIPSNLRRGRLPRCAVHHLPRLFSVPEP
jgi:hypothetical protein